MGYCTGEGARPFGLNQRVSTPARHCPCPGEIPPEHVPLGASETSSDASIYCILPVGLDSALHVTDSAQRVPTGFKHTLTTGFPVAADSPPDETTKVETGSLTEIKRISARHSAVVNRSASTPTPHQPASSSSLLRNWTN